MGATPWVLISILILLILFGVCAFLMYKQRKMKRPTDYRAFFYIGIVWLIAGLPFKNYTLSFMGLVFAIVGLLNKDKWKKNAVNFKKMNKSEKRLRVALILLLAVLLVFGIIVYIKFSDLLR